LTVEHLPISSIKFDPRNPRKHSDKQIGQIASSMATFGFLVPVVIDRNDRVVAGEARIKAADRLGMASVPVIRAAHLSDEQIRAFRLDGNDGGKDDPLDELPPLEEVAVTDMGDCWLVGPHKIVCGNAIDPETFERLFAGEPLAQMVLDDPPYNVPINKHVGGLGKIRHREFPQASGELDDQAFIKLLAAAFTNSARCSLPGALHYHFMDWRHTEHILAAARGVYSAQINLCVWNKQSGAMGSFYRSQHELIHVFKCGKGSHINNVQLGRNRRYRTNVWSYRGANSFGQARADLAMHPTVKPVALVADAILDASEPKAVILDAFAGSGTTLVAAHKTRRRGFGIELDPLYCDLIVRRLEAVTKTTATLAETGETFAQVAARRATSGTGDDA
jgi:DNA modification methylase